MKHVTDFFDRLAEGIIQGLTFIIHDFSGVLQSIVYLLLAFIFLIALAKAFQCFRTLARLDRETIANRSSGDFPQAGIPLSVIAANFFIRAKYHYIRERRKDDRKTVPPDSFLRDAAFQFTDRYFEEKFLHPLNLLGNLLPPLGFIGTIIGMVIHFLASTGAFNREVTVAGLATALYTTLIALVCFTSVEFMKKVFYSMARKRIEEGLESVGKERMGKTQQDQSHAS